MDQNEMTYCPACGNQLNGKVIFCRYCGIQIESMEKDKEQKDKEQKEEKQIGLPNAYAVRQCLTLKQIRQAVADANGIFFQAQTCGQEELCTGICPGCEKEGMDLEEALEKLRASGKQLVWPDATGLLVGLLPGNLKADRTLYLKRTEALPREERTTGLVRPPEPVQKEEPKKQGLFSKLRKLGRKK